MNGLYSTQPVRAALGGEYLEASKLIEWNGLRYYQTPLQVTHGIFTRAGGVSPAPYAGLNVGGTVGDSVANVRANHALMYAALQVPGELAVTTWQVHGADVVTAHAPLAYRKWHARADGIITDRRGLPLVMRFADCVPLLYHDPAHQAIGLAHAGWRGTAAGIASAMIRAMQASFGSRPEDVQVVIGPSISQEHFQVGEEVVAAFERRFGKAEGLVRRDLEGRAYVDLWQANALELMSAGVRQIHIHTMGLCTFAQSDVFFSHRAHGGRTGRFGVVICL